MCIRDRYMGDYKYSMTYPYPDGVPTGYNPSQPQPPYPQGYIPSQSQPVYPSYVPPQIPYAPQPMYNTPYNAQVYPPQSAIPMVMMSSNVADDLAWREHEFRVREYELKRREQQAAEETSCCFCCACLTGCCLASMLSDD
eukprot:TRINITY_DN8264_c0_g2_i3.p1 TRINITY_DN8264_c0_g2~~TRINITY_DN8264_c0_g2_i3.p1  ORF type:complete len:140 (-),score=23.36 TRINITY_DN8264_c0_g2_i3:171-590(-)